MCKISLFYVHSELLPVLPAGGIFSIDALMRKGSLTNVDADIWQWKDDRNMWHSYSQIDSKIIEVSRYSEKPVNLTGPKDRKLLLVQKIGSFYWSKR